MGSDVRTWWRLHEDHGSERSGVVVTLAPSADLLKGGGEEATVRANVKVDDERGVHVGRTDVQDQAWHNALCARWRDPLIRWLAYQIGPDHRSFEDITQEVLLAAWSKRHQRPGDSPEEAGAWLFKMARGMASNHRRGRARFDATLLRMFPLQHHPGDDYRTVEMRQDFLKAYLQLSPKEQETFYLENCGFTAPEIADIVGGLPAAVRQRTKRARHKLSQHMQDYNSPAPPQRLATTGGSS